MLKLALVLSACVLAPETLFAAPEFAAPIVGANLATGPARGNVSLMHVCAQ